MGTAQCDKVQWAKEACSSCIICLEASPPPVQSGCACRSDSGLAHLACLVNYAVFKQAEGGTRVWAYCQTCKQEFTGPTRLGLAETWWSRVCREPAENSERLLATQNLASCYLDVAKYADAEKFSLELHDVLRRTLGDGHRQTMASAYNLANALSFRGKLADAVQLHLTWHRVRRNVLGEDDPDTLLSAWLLASFWAAQGHLVPASNLYHHVLSEARRVHGNHDPMTLRTASTYALALSKQGRHTESEKLLRELLPIQTRVLGTEHPEVHFTALTLARVECAMSRAPGAATIRST